MKKILKSFPLLVLLVLCYACSDNDNNNEPDIKIEEVRVIGTLKADHLKLTYQQMLQYISSMSYISDVEIEAAVSKIKYDVALTVISYEVKDPFGVSRKLSGVVGYPIIPAGEKDKKMRIVSDLHGTIVWNENYPSNRTDANMLDICPHLIFAGHENGYIFALPDYFGYGTDKDNMHYYEHRETLASASRGMIDIVPAYAEQKSLVIDFDKLYITGYSEGGFATLSTLKSYSETSSQFKDFVAVGGAGGYDSKESFEKIVKLTQGDILFVSSYAWVVMTYNKVYDINRKWDELFQAKWIDELKKHEGKNTIMMSEEGSLPDTPVDLFASPFADGILDGSDKAFVDALNDNDVSNFNAKGKVYLIHGTDDPWVPAFNTDVAYDRLKAKGSDVEKIVVEGGTHDDITPYVWLLKIKTVLDRND